MVPNGGYGLVLLVAGFRVVAANVCADVALDASQARWKRYRQGSR